MRRHALLPSPLVVLAAFALFAAGQVRPAEVIPASFGEVFPSGSYRNLNAGAAGGATLDLKAVIGRKPVVLFYWIPGSTRSEKMLVELQSLCGELGPSKIVLYGVVVPRPDLGLDEKKIRTRVRELKIHVPVLEDEGFHMGRLLNVRRVPFVALLDAEGKLRLTNGGGLRQTLEYKMTLEDGIRRLARTGTLGSYGELPRYYPVQELVGKKCPDFEAPLLGSGEKRHWSEMLASDKLNVLLFWSVDCPHCRKALPEINDWLKKNGKGINLVGSARVRNDADRTRTAEYSKMEGLVFPNLVDENRAVMDLFQVISTPTLVFIGPDGLIDSAVTSGAVNFGGILAEKRKEFLKAS